MIIHCQSDKHSGPQYYAMDGYRSHDVSCHAVVDLKLNSEKTLGGHILPIRWVGLFAFLKH